MGILSVNKKVIQYDNKILRYYPSDFFNVQHYGVISSETLDQTDAIRTVLENYQNVYFPGGTYRCRNLYIKNNNQSIWIDGTIDGNGALEVKDFKYLFNIETGSTGVLIKNCSFNDYTNLGTIDSSATFENNCFNDVFYATGYPTPTPSSMHLRLLFDASLGVTRIDANVSS